MVNKIESIKVGKLALVCDWDNIHRLYMYDERRSNSKAVFKVQHVTTSDFLQGHLLLH